MRERILVAYASRKGSTAEVAAAIGETLRMRGFDVDVASVNDHPSATGYAAVLIGSAVNAGQWLPTRHSFSE